MDDVTLLKTSDGLTADVRFRGGTTTSLALPPALSAWQLRQTSPKVVVLVDQLLDQRFGIRRETVRSATSIPSLRSSPWIWGAPP